MLFMPKVKQKKNLLKWSEMSFASALLHIRYLYIENYWPKLFIVNWNTFQFNLG